MPDCQMPDGSLRSVPCSCRRSPLENMVFMPRWHEFNDLSINHLSFDCQLTVNQRDATGPCRSGAQIIANGEIDMALVSDTIKRSLVV